MRKLAFIPLGALLGVLMFFASSRRSWGYPDSRRHADISQHKPVHAGLGHGQRDVSPSAPRDRECNR